MTKMHFRRLANSLGLLLRETEGSTGQGVRLAVQAVADVCAESNPQFDRERFVSAVELVAAGGKLLSV